MTARCEEVRELITGLVDNELSAVERLEIEGHLRECAGCRLVYGREAALKREIHAAAAGLTAPADLRRKIASEIRKASLAADLLRRLVNPFRPASPVWVFVSASLVLMILPVWYLMTNAVSSVPLAALRMHSRIVEGAIPIARAQEPEEIDRRLLHSEHAPFTPVGHELPASNLKAVGGAVRTVHGREVMVTVYEGEAPSVTCYLFLGTEKEAPSAAGAFFDPEKRVHFYTFSGEGVNAVLHRDGDFICILVSSMPLQDLLAIARSKARPA